jgi:hypothetical protein
MARWQRASLLVLSAACLAFLNSGANAASCRDHGKFTRAAIGSHVAAMQRLEHEASDRIKGLDSRPFDFLLGEARKAAAIIADPAWLEDEGDLNRCRNLVRPIRRPCADAAQAFVAILEKHVANEKAEYDKALYAAPMAVCEKAMGLKELKSLIRGSG